MKGGTVAWRHRSLDVDVYILEVALRLGEVCAACGYFTCMVSIGFLTFDVKFDKTVAVYQL